jgi:hypothetical protein
MSLNEDIKIIRDVDMSTPILVKTLTTLIYSLELVSYSSLGKVYVLPCRGEDERRLPAYNHLADVHTT